jgi:hypothetical protein
MTPMRGPLRLVARALLVWLALAATESTALAVPAFARKYQTSCQTCHIVFPKLNAFGEAFRLRGYRMPGETEEMVKEKPVSLGAPAYKRLWPKAVWPSDLPATVPLAVNLQLADVNTSTLNEDGTVTSVKNDLQFPQEVSIFGAGTLGENISFWAELVFHEKADASVEIELEQARIAFDSPFGPEDAFHFRVGKFKPNLSDGFVGNMSTDAGIDSLTVYNPVGINGGTGLAEDVSPRPIALPEGIRGIEGYGIIAHRALWIAGLANGVSPGPNGAFDGNSAKDVYARFDYKIGGMGLDGDMGGTPIPEKNWRDNSLRLGVFTYRGDASDIPFAVTTDEGLKVNIEDTHFLRTGVYASWFFQDLNVFGVYLHGTDSLNTFDATTNALLHAISPDYHAWFAQVDYVVYPWLQATARYDTVTPADPSVRSLRTGVFNVSALVRANVKAMVEYQRNLREGDNHSLSAFVRFLF